MWRHNLRAFARWGLRQRPPGQQAEHAERLVASPAEDRRGDRDDRRKETCHEEGRCFTRRPECRFAEAVGWVGLAVGLNVQLHSRLWRNDKNGRPEETSRKAGLCGLLQSVVFRLASASPAVKSVLPESGAAAESASPRSPDEEMSSALREYLSLLEECEAARLLARGDAAGSIACFQRAPDSARAHFNLGICYQDGRGGLAPDRNKALEHYREAALRGHPMATYNLGLLLHQQQDHRGLQLLQTAADLGVAQAQAFVGYVRLQEGRFPEAVCLLSRAAQTQDADALFYLGLCSERGLGVPRDPSHALHHYSRAAHKGHAGAREAIARLAPEPTKTAWGDALSAGPQLCPAQ